ncbi:MAG: class II aldolase/adducin family protein [Flavobacteriaceae bacterium]
MINQELIHFIEMSRYAGERFDLVQAGGGNTSVKYDGNKMYIKASGFLLSEVSTTKGFCTVLTDKVVSIMDDLDVVDEADKRKKDMLASQKLNGAIFDGDNRPSIETYLHSLLYKYTLHVHAIAVNVFTSDKDWRNKLNELDSRALLVPYETPGIALALLLKDLLARYKSANGRLPKLVFLQNHGLIISSDNYEEVEELTERIVKKAERKAGLNFSRYRSTNMISRCYNRAFDSSNTTYLSEDKTIEDLLRRVRLELLQRPFSPDGFVFCGYSVLYLQELSEKEFTKYRNRYYEEPKMIVYDGHLYIVAADLKKAKMIEDVFKNNLLIANALDNDLNFLEASEIEFLGNWEAEKYRKEL